MPEDKSIDSTRGRFIRRLPWYAVASPCIVLGVMFMLSLTPWVLPRETRMPQDLANLKLVLWNLAVGQGAGMLIVLALVTLRKPRGQSTLSELRLRPWRPVYLLLGVGIGLIATLFILGLIAIVLSGLESLNLKVPANPLINFLLKAPWDVVLALALGAVLLAPLAEELIFRLVFYRTARLLMPHVPAAILVSLLFALIHSDLWGLPLLFCLGLIFQEAYKRTDSLWPPIIIHAFFNAVNVGFALLQRFYPGQ